MRTLEDIPLPFIIGIIKLLVEAGKDSLIKDIKLSVDKDNALPIIPTSDIRGGIDKTKKKAS
jgi:CRISPR/Cas system CMR subunit Cmr6 (Cas7 group RAMP superfamily)